MGELGDITVEILVPIRDEIRGLRADTNLRFEQMDKRFELMNERLLHIETDISQMKADIKAIAAPFERSYLLLSSEMEGIKDRLSVCERRSGI